MLDKVTKCVGLVATIASAILGLFFCGSGDFTNGLLAFILSNIILMVNQEKPKEQ